MTTGQAICEEWKFAIPMTTKHWVVYSEDENCLDGGRMGLNRSESTYIDFDDGDYDH
jgi:hypothetical protein